MDSKSTVVAIYFWIVIIYVQALEEFAEPRVNDARIFSIYGINKFRRHSDPNIDCTDPTKFIGTSHASRELLKKYLMLKSRQRSEIVDLVAKQSHRRPLPLKTSYLEIKEVLYEAKNMHYDGLKCTHDSTTVCLPWSRKNLKEWPWWEDYLDEMPHRPDCVQIRLDQHMKLADIKIEGFLRDKADKNADKYFSITFVSPVMRTIYERTLSTTQGYVTRSFTEKLIMENIILNSTILEKPELLNSSTNTKILQKVAKVWMAPVMDEIKNQHTYIEILQQSENISNTFIGDVLQKFVEEVRRTITREYYYASDDDCSENDVNVIRFSFFFNSRFQRFRVAHYESVINLNDASDGHYTFTHLFHIKYEAKATSNPIVTFEGWNSSAAGEEGEKFAQAAIKGIPVQELSLGFEIDSDKFGKPLSMTKRYRVNIRLAFDDTHPQKILYIKLQKKLSRLITGSFQERINKFFFRSTEA